MALNLLYQDLKKTPKHRNNMYAMTTTIFLQKCEFNLMHESPRDALVHI